MFFDFKKTSLVSMRKAAAENDKNVSTKLITALFENKIGSKEVSGERVWKNYGYLDAR